MPDELKEPRKPDLSFMSPTQQLKALKEYKTARKRWLKALKKQEANLPQFDILEFAKRKKRDD